MIHEVLSRDCSSAVAGTQHPCFAARVYAVWRPCDLVHRHQNAAAHTRARPAEGAARLLRARLTACAAAGLRPAPPRARAGGRGAGRRADGPAGGSGGGRLSGLRVGQSICPRAAGALRAAGAESGITRPGVGVLVFRITGKSVTCAQPCNFLFLSFPSRSQGGRGPCWNKRPFCSWGKWKRYFQQRCLCLFSFIWSVEEFHTLVHITSPDCYWRGSLAAKLACVRIFLGVRPRRGAGHASVSLRAKKDPFGFFQVCEIVRIETFCLTHCICLIL